MSPIDLEPIVTKLANQIAHDAGKTNPLIQNEIDSWDGTDQALFDAGVAAGAVAINMLLQEQEFDLLAALEGLKSDAG